jgi:cytochrome c oxidase assembly factor CtaG
LQAWRVASFAAGALAVAMVQLPPLDGLADDVLMAHMIQHIIIGDIASLLIVIGLTGPVLQPLLHIRPTRPLRVVTHPVVALILWARSARSCGSRSSVRCPSPSGSAAGDASATS